MQRCVGLLYQEKVDIQAQHPISRKNCSFSNLHLRPTPEVSQSTQIPILKWYNLILIKFFMTLKTKQNPTTSIWILLRLKSCSCFSLFVCKFFIVGSLPYNLKYLKATVVVIWTYILTCLLSRHQAEMQSNAFSQDWIKLTY